MEHLAEEAIAGADQDTLEEAVKTHLMNCPGCREHHLDKIHELEKRISTWDISHNPALKLNAK